MIYPKIKGFMGRTSKKGQVKCTGGRKITAVSEQHRKAKGNQADGWSQQKATSPDKHQKEDPAQAKHREDRSKQKKNKREIWHLPKCHPIKPAALSGEQGNSRHWQAPEPE